MLRRKDNLTMSIDYVQQKRVLTIRECARAQGFPDHWKFLSDSKRPSTIVRDVRRCIEILAVGR